MSSGDPIDYLNAKIERLTTALEDIRDVSAKSDSVQASTEEMLMYTIAIRALSDRS